MDKKLHLPTINEVEWMLQTLEAVINNERGQLQFSAPLKFTQAQRVLVTLLNESSKPNLNHLEGMSHIVKFM